MKTLYTNPEYPDYNGSTNSAIYFYIPYCFHCFQRVFMRKQHGIVTSRVTGQLEQQTGGHGQWIRQEQP